MPQKTAVRSPVEVALPVFNIVFHVVPIPEDMVRVAFPLAVVMAAKTALPAVVLTPRAGLGAAPPDFPSTVLSWTHTPEQVAHAERVTNRNAKTNSNREYFILLVCSHDEVVASSVYGRRSDHFE